MNEAQQPRAKIAPRITSGEAPQSAPQETRINMRPALREDPRDAAAKRAEELRARRSEQPALTDEFDVSYLEERKPGWKFQWCAWSVAERRDTSNMMAIEDRGWTYVAKDEFPELMPRDSDLDVIMRKGMVLMEIPKEIHQDYVNAELKAARDQVRWKEEAIAGTPDGTMTRDHAQVRPKINKSFEAMKIPD